VKATSSNGLTADAPLTLADGSKIPTTYTNGSKTSSLIGESIYAVATGNSSSDYAGSTATSDLIKVTGDINQNNDAKITVTPSDVKVGTVLTADSTAIKDLSTNDYSVQWYSVDSNGNLTAISGATSLTYTVDKAFAGGKLAVKITGAGNYTGTITSNTISVANA
jgi:hypothetical protein